MKQPWSTGRIGTQSLSYGAHTTTALACLDAPGLAALGAPEIRNDPARRAALQAIDIEEWFGRMPWSRGHSPLSLIPEYEDYVFDQWEHGVFDDFWRQVGLYAEGSYDRHSDVPILWMSSWYDPYPRTATDNYVALARRAGRTDFRHGLRAPDRNRRHARTTVRRNEQQPSVSFREMTCGACSLPKSGAWPFGSVKAPGWVNLPGALCFWRQRQAARFRHEIPMSIHKLNPERAAADDISLSVGLEFQHKVFDLADSVIKMRAMRALESTATRYPIFRRVRCAARRKLEDIFDDLATQSGLAALRLAAAIRGSVAGWRKDGGAVPGVRYLAQDRLHDIQNNLFIWRFTRRYPPGRRRGTSWFRAIHAMCSSTSSQSRWPKPLSSPS